MSNFSINFPTTSCLSARRLAVLFEIACSSLICLFPVQAIAATLGFENGFNGWDTSGTASIENANFGVIPTEGTSQALLSTVGENNSPVFELVFQIGLGGLPVISLGSSLEGQGMGQGFLFSGAQISSYGNGGYTQGSALKATIDVNAGDTLKFDYNFLTNENSSAQNVGDDLAFFSINEELIKITMFSEVESSMEASATPFSKETGYQEYSYTFSTGGDFILGFGVLDQNDVLGDSGLLLDNIRIETANTVTVPEPGTILGTLVAIGFAVRSLF